MTRSKIEQQVKTLLVHPDLAAECVDYFLPSMITAGLGTMEGDALILHQAQTPPEQNEEEDIEEPGEELSTEGGHKKESNEGIIQPIPPTTTPPTRKSGTAAINLTIDVDSSSDPDKLEKQLKLLRTYGLV